MNKLRILVGASGDFASSYGGGQVYIRRLVQQLGGDYNVHVAVVSCVDEQIATIQEYRVRGILVYQIGTSDFVGSLKKVVMKEKPHVIHSNGAEYEYVFVGRECGIPVVFTAHHGGVFCPGGSALNQEDKVCSVQGCHEACFPCVLSSQLGGKCMYRILRHFPLRFLDCLGSFLKRGPFIYFVSPWGGAAHAIQSHLRRWRYIYEHCAKVIAPSIAVAELMIRNRMPEEKISLVPHGVEIRDNVSEFPDATAGKIKFYYVGRVNRVKGLHVLIESFQQVGSPDAELHIIGGSGTKQEERYMRKLQQKSENDSRITWHGKVPEQDVNDIVAPYHILVHPAICLEVFGLNIAEALSQGKWVLATRCGGAEMQIREGENGWLVAPNSVNDLKIAIERIIQSPPTAAPRYKGYISMKEHARRVMQVYEEVLAEKK